VVVKLPAYVLGKRTVEKDTKHSSMVSRGLQSFHHLLSYLLRGFDGRSSKWLAAILIWMALFPLR
jgi:hypothetical protein